MYKLGSSSCALFFVFLYNIIENVALDEDSDCICKRVRNCPPAIDALRTHSDGFKIRFKRCGFTGKDELVCCPSVKAGNTNNNDDDLESRFIRRKCVQACEEIANLARSVVEFKISDGENTTIEYFPHMVVLGYERDEGLSWDCGATIISQRFLLTAAHCIVNKNRLRPTVARMGVTRLNDPNPNDFGIKNITVNSKYNLQSKHNDIALIEVDREINFSDNMFPACLYFKHDDPLRLIVTGWGKTSISNTDDRSNILQKATVVATPLDKCNTSYVTRSSGSITIVQTQICAGSNSSDACWGDSGGPLQMLNKDGTYSIVGIISYGAGCGGKIPGVYTRVSKYLKWIEKVVWP